MGSAVSSVGRVLAGVSTGGLSEVAGGLAPKYTDTDALQGISNQQLQGAQDAQAQLNGLAPQRSQFGQALANQALGQAPSISEAQLKQAMDRNLSQQIAAAKANRSINPALAARMNVQQANQTAQATAQQSAVNRLAEQQASQQAFGNYLGQQQQAGANYLNGAAQSQSGVMNTQFANQQRGINMFSGLAQGGMQMAAMMSDENLKTAIKKYNKGGMVKKPKKMASGGFVMDENGDLTFDSKNGDPALDSKKAKQAPDNSTEKNQTQTPLVSAANMIPNVVGGAGVPDAMANSQDMRQMGHDFGSFLSKLGKSGPKPMAGGPMDNMGGGMGEMPVDPSMFASMPLPAAHGAMVPGQAKVHGDSEKNDTVPALLSPGEVVVPRTVVAKGSKEVAKFVAQAIKQKSQPTDQVQKKADGGQVDEYHPQAFLDSLKAVSYNYKKHAAGPGVSPGRKLGVMAQDLEKTPVGKQMVKETPMGKQVDMGAGFGAILAAQAHLNDRLKNLESKYGKKK